MITMQSKTGVIWAILLLSALVLAACGGNVEGMPQSQDDVPRISAQELKNRLDRGDEILVVDARSAGEYAERHVEGAISVPLGELESRLDEFPRDQEIVFYCT